MYLFERLRVSATRSSGIQLLTGVDWRAFLVFWVLWLPAAAQTTTPPRPFPEPKQLELHDELGQGVQRFMQRLESSTAQHENTVRVLFYGQSITEQNWTNLVSADLRTRYPHVHFVIENRAIGGFASNLLVLTSEADLYPFYPDLMIFYDYGRHDNYEDMIRRTRARTTSEIILQTDHLNNAANLTEETDPAKLDPHLWSSWFPNVWIPTVAHKYQTGMVQQRALWKIYCQQNHLDPVNLTVDGAHLNDEGNALMAKIVEAYLVRRPQYDDPSMDAEVRDYPLGREVKWNGTQLEFSFTGNKLDVIAQPGATGTADILIDGKKPSQFPELYQATRVSGYPGIGWPIISRVSHRAPLVLEDWTARATGFSPDGKHFKFSVTGSVTGADGDGNSDDIFVSKSGRVVIAPEDWNIAYSFGLMQGPWAHDKSKPPFVIPTEIIATWKIVPLFTNTYSAPAIPDPAVETPVIIAQGLANGPHVLRMTARGGTVSFTALRVYQPSSTFAEPTDSSNPATQPPVPTFAPPIQKVQSKQQ